MRLYFYIITSCVSLAVLTFTCTALASFLIIRTTSVYSAEARLRMGQNMNMEESVGLRSAHCMKDQGSVNTPSCEVTVSKVGGHWPVFGAALTPDKVIALSPQ